MKTTLIFGGIILFLAMLSCQSKDGTPTAMLNEKPDSAQLGMRLSLGEFASGAHTTSGKASIYTLNSSQTLVFENFRTDNGPDLRVYLSKDKSAQQFREVGKLKSVQGNFTYALPADLKASDYPFVLIWCEDFSVLFGAAELKAPM